VTVRIYHTSDLHDHVGFAARLREMRAEHPGLLLDCGDSLRGSQTVYHRRERIIAEIDAAGYDVQAMGNREFHYLYGCVKARIAQMQHPVVCSNLVDTKGRDLPFKPAIRLQCDGTLVHLLGLLIMQYPVGSAWERVFGWRFLDPVETVRAYARSMPEGEPLIVMSHLGLSLDRKLADAVPRIDLLLGGHSHDTLHEAVLVNGVPIVHAGPYGRFVSQTDLQRAAGRWSVQNFELVPLLAA
jgi:5'-nucleotidase